MNDAANTPAVRKYSKRETNTADLEVGQHEDVDISLGSTIVHGEGLVNLSADEQAQADYRKELAFNEEPVEILINENNRSDFPETHVPVQVNGRGAEVMMNGKWVELAWLPIGTPIVVKRKYVEVLARSKSDSVKTQHDDANVERPQNKIIRRTAQNYPVSILRDENPRGAQWISNITRSH